MWQIAPPQPSHQFAKYCVCPFLGCVLAMCYGGGSDCDVSRCYSFGGCGWINVLDAVREGIGGGIGGNSVVMISLWFLWWLWLMLVESMCWWLCWILRFEGDWRVLGIIWEQCAALSLSRSEQRALTQIWRSGWWRATKASKTLTRLFFGSLKNYALIKHCKNDCYVGKSLISESG